MASFKFLDLPPELRIAVYHYVLPPKGCYYYVHESARCHYPPSDYENLRITCRQVKYEIEQEVMSDIPASIAAITDFGQYARIVAELAERPLYDENKWVGAMPPSNAWILIKTPSTYKESRKLEITIPVPHGASPEFIGFALMHVKLGLTHMRTLEIHLQFDGEKNMSKRDVNRYVSRAWYALDSSVFYRKRELPHDHVKRRDRV